jgi:RNA polymerase sigma-70 factor (ECF subfamily)
MTEVEIKFEKVTGKNFNDFYNDYKPKLKWYISKYTKDLELAEEITQETFIQGLKKIDTFNSEKSQIQTWITTIGKNLAIKDYNDKKKNQLVSIDKECSEESETNLLNFLPYDDGNEKIKRENETLLKYNIMVSEIEKLPLKYKEVIIMREVDKMQYQEIAENLKRNLSTVKSQIRKGRQLLQDAVQDKFNKIDKNGIE